MRLGALFAEIMVVDGEPDLVRSVRIVLQSAGYVVRSVADGRTALEKIKARPPDLIVLDATLPDMDGYQIVRRLKADTELPFVPVIMTAARAQQSDVAACLNAGADEVIGKPLDNAELLTRVRAMLRFKATTDELADLNVTLEQKVLERTRELEEAHIRLRHAEKLSSLGRLAASIAHEINNPLTGILNYTYLIKAELPSDSAVQEDMAMIERQINVIALLVQQLRDFSKPPCKKRRRVTFNEVLDDVIALTRKELQKRHIEIVTELDPALLPAMASPEQLSEIFMNLILNARDAMPDGGRLTIRAFNQDNWVLTEVIDTGQGIAPEALEHIFEPFFTTKGEGGTGLGLAICHSIAHDHGGEIKVNSQLGQGTVFTLLLPVYQEEVHDGH